MKAAYIMVWPNDAGTRYVMEGAVFVLVLLAAALALLTIHVVVPAWRQLHFIAGARPSAIGALSAGEVALLEGQATGVALPSAVAGVPCVLWQVEVQEYRSAGRSGHWATIGRYAAAPPLLVDDGTGTVVVELRGATLELRTAFSATSGLLSPLPPHVERALERFAVPTRAPWGFRRSLRVIERRVEVGQPLVVCGIFHGGERPALRAHANAPLLISDRSIGAIRGKLVARLAFVALLLLGLPILTLLALGTAL